MLLPFVLANSILICRRSHDGFKSSALDCVTVAAWPVFAHASFSVDAGSVMDKHINTPRHFPCTLPVASFRPAQAQSSFVGFDDSAAGSALALPKPPQAAGLVPYKTNRISVSGSSDLTIELNQNACADRRVRRLKRSVWASGHLHGLAENGFRPSVPWFVTLTYADANGWRANHVSKALEGFRNWCKSRAVPCRYSWVGEIQPKRLVTTGDAAVHYHLLAWLPVGVRMPMWDRRTVTGRGFKRAAFWSHGMTQRAVALSGVGYLMKYLSKLGELTRFPKGLRLYGIGGLNATGRSVRAWFNLPQWVKNSYGVGDVCRRAGGYVVRATGEILEAAYSVRLVPGALLLRALRELPARWHDGAYSSVSFAP